MKDNFTISNILENKAVKQRAKILKDKLTTQIFVCLYLCGGNCSSDPTCLWKVEA